MSTARAVKQGEKRATFTAMADTTTPQEWVPIVEAMRDFAGDGADRVLNHLRLLKGDFGGFAIDRLDHSLQSASLAMRAGRDEEFVVCALLHDIGDTLACYNHAELAAAVLQPFVSERHHWMVEKHGVFQGYYFFHHVGLDRDMRDEFRGHPHFEYTADFCQNFDQNAFDPGYDIMPLEAFEPMVRRVMERPKRSIYMKESAAGGKKQPA